MSDQSEHPRRHKTFDERKQYLRWLNTGHETTRVGLPSGRNKARPYKAPRIIENPDGSTSLHPLDAMKVAKVNPDGSVTTRQTQTNGRMGDISTFQGGGVTRKSPFPWHKENINLDRMGRDIVTKGAKGRVRNPRKRKRPGFKTAECVPLAYDQMLFRQLYNLRNDLTTAIWLSSLLGVFTVDKDAIAIKTAIDKFLMRDHPREWASLVKRDENAKQSLMGKVFKGQITEWRGIKSLEQRLERAAISLNRMDNLGCSTIQTKVGEYDRLKAQKEQQKASEILKEMDLSRVLPLKPKLEWPYNKINIPL